MPPPEPAQESRLALAGRLRRGGGHGLFLRFRGHSVFALMIFFATAAPFPVPGDKRCPKTVSILDKASGNRKADGLLVPWRPLMGPWRGEKCGCQASLSPPESPPRFEIHLLIQDDSVMRQTAENPIETADGLYGSGAMGGVQARCGES